MGKGWSKGAVVEEGRKGLSWVGGAEAGAGKGGSAAGSGALGIGEDGGAESSMLCNQPLRSQYDHQSS